MLDPVAAESNSLAQLPYFVALGSARHDIYLTSPSPTLRRDLFRFEVADIVGTDGSLGRLAQGDLGFDTDE